MINVGKEGSFFKLLNTPFSIPLADIGFLMALYLGSLTRPLHRASVTNDFVTEDLVELGVREEGLVLLLH